MCSINHHYRNGVVRHESVMRLRNKLKKLRKMKGVNQDKEGESFFVRLSFTYNIYSIDNNYSDPEDFLNMLFKHFLHVPPFLDIK